MTSKFNSKMLRSWFAAFSLGAVMIGTGCQSTYNGQTLPSGYYLKDDIHYAAPGTEFKLSREAAALKAQQAELISAPQH